MDKIEKIRQEIERLKGICMAQIKTNPGQAFPFVMEMTGYDKLLSFIDTLSEKPGKSLEEAAQQNSDKYAVEDILEKPYHYVDDAFIAGAEWQASQMPMPEDTVLFNKGVAEGRRLEREQMLKDAVETEVWNYSSDEDLRAIPLFGIEKFNNLKDGDKVRIVVLKEEE